jgi:large subunit ribosomal protein L18
MGNTNPSSLKRIRRKKAIRKKLFGTAERPRLCVFRSARHIYVQVINDEDGRTILSASTLDGAFDDTKLGGNLAAAKAIGLMIGERAKAAGIDKVVFDRNGFLFHGRVKALADSAREAGLQF